MSLTATQTNSRELAFRESDGLAVALFWCPNDDAVTISVADDCTGDRFEIPVAPEHALDAFYHPFAYAGPQASRVVCV